MTKENVAMVELIMIVLGMGMFIVNPYLSLLIACGALAWILYWIHKEEM